MSALLQQAVLSAYTVYIEREDHPDYITIYPQIVSSFYKSKSNEAA